MRLSTLGFLVATPGLLLLAACGDDDDADADTPAETPAESGAAAADDGVVGADAGAAVLAAADDACAATSITGTTPNGTAFEATSAVAANIQDGAAYTLYIGDFDLTLDSFGMISNPEVPADGIMWTVAVTIFNAAAEDIVPIEAGTVVEADRPFGELTFTVVAQEGEAFFGASAGQTGTVTVTAVGDTFCGTIEYTDDEKSIAGTFQAPTKPI